MPAYCYSPLTRPDNIRLLELLPSKADPKNIRCRLLEYPFRNSNGLSYPYEAVSYTWGSEDKPQSITIEDQSLSITQNLYDLLLRLQDLSCSRIIWVDAICINQDNDEEKEHQIQFMAEIYAKAQQVIVWLGETRDDSGQALEAVRLAGETSTKPLNSELYERAIPQLLQRQWFQRMWVLQEVSAARRISIMCGSTEIDGHAFCLGVGFLGIAKSERVVRVTTLIRGAIFRSRQIPRYQGRLSLGIFSLGELVDMYHAHEATRFHDKIYALLGMCTDDPTLLRAAGLEPDYSLEPKELMKNLVKYLFGTPISVETWNDKELAVIKSNVYAFGRVSNIQSNDDFSNNVQRIHVNFSDTSKKGMDKIASWTLLASAKAVKAGDIICFIPGVSDAIIVRACADHFVIIMRAAVPPEQITGSDMSQLAADNHDFRLVWNWDVSSDKVQDSDKALEQIDRLLPRYPGIDFESRRYSLIQRQNILHVLRDVGVWKVAVDQLYGVMQEYKEDAKKIFDGWTNIDMGTLLSYAVLHNHEAVVKLLGKARAATEAEDEFGQTPLVWATKNERGAMIKLLLEAKANTEVKDERGETPLLRAAKKGHEVVVKLLLEAKANTEVKNATGQTPLSLAAQNGHEAVVTLLLEARGNTEATAEFLQKPLANAALFGHETVVKLLLDAGAGTEIEVGYGETPLVWTAKRGHEDIVKLLLKAKANTEATDEHGETPLLWAAEYGNGTMIKLLLEAKANIEAKGQFHQSPLASAALFGHEAAVKLLLEAKANTEVKDERGETPLLRAAKNGHEAVVKLLLEAKAEIMTKDNYGKTPLLWAVSEGHEAIAKLLQSSASE